VQFKAFTREGDLLSSSDYGILALWFEEKGGSFKWDPEAESPILRNINVEIKKGMLVAIVGTVGTRISAFLECILGEMEKIAGKVCCLSNPL